MKKDNLFKPEEITEIHVKCPVTGKDYLVAENDPDCFCPACGEPHDVKDYHVFYKDGSECSAKTCHIGKIPETPYVPSELIHSDEDPVMDVEVNQEYPVVPMSMMASPSYEKCQSDEDFCNLDL